MTKRTVVSMALLTAFTLLIAAGCSDGAGDSESVEGPSDMPPATVETDGNGHDHPSEGPHGGDLIELGNEEYHAELLHPHDHDDDAHAREGDTDAGQTDENPEHPDHDHAGITIFILDGSAKNVVPIAATEIAINLKHDGKGEQFKLAAMPTKDDPEGKSSRFASADKDLLEHFQEEEIEGTLVLKINGKSYRGKIEHDHDHKGHDHKGHDHKGHDHD